MPEKVLELGANLHVVSGLLFWSRCCKSVTQWLFPRTRGLWCPGNRDGCGSSFFGPTQLSGYLFMAVYGEEVVSRGAPRGGEK